MDTKHMFMRYISHELRNPLNAVFMGLDLLHEHVVDDKTELRQILNDISPSRQKAVEVLNTLLSMEKIDLGITQLERTLIPLGAFLKEAMDPFTDQVCSLTYI